MALPDRSALIPARFWAIVEAVLYLLVAAVGKFAVHNLEQAPDEVPGGLTAILADLSSIWLAIGCGLVVIAWGLNRAQWWAVVACAVYHAVFLVRVGTGVAGGGGSWFLWAALLVHAYVLFLLLHPGTLAAVGMWPSSAARMRRQSGYPGPGYETPAYEPPSGYSAAGYPPSPPKRW